MSNGPARRLHLYAVAVGSNRRHGRHGSPERVVVAAIEALATSAVDVLARSPILPFAPVGLRGRRFANAAILIETPHDPPTLLALLKARERAFGRRPGRRWASRVLDLDILLWSGGAWRSPQLTIPHPRLAERRFVLDPLLTIAPDWRGGRGALTVRHIHARLTRRGPLHRS